MTRSDLIVCMCFTCHLEEEDAELAPTQHQVSSPVSTGTKWKVSVIAVASEHIGRFNPVWLNLEVHERFRGLVQSEFWPVDIDSGFVSLFRIQF